MTASPGLDSLDLAALLCSRVCHDLISPVGAIVNGLEVLEDEDDESMKTFALELIKKSAGQASARLQFCRIAFGAAGSAGASIDLGDAENVARGFIADEKTTLVWNLPRALLPKNQVKLLLNLLLMAGYTIPRGGSLTADQIGTEGTQGFQVRATGPLARVPPQIAPLVGGDFTQGVDAQGVQFAYTGMLARDCGMNVSLNLEGDTVLVVARSGTPDPSQP